MKKSELTQIEQKAKYITLMVKSVNKSKDYALSIVEWYSITEKEVLYIKEHINKIW